MSNNIKKEFFKILIMILAVIILIIFFFIKEQIILTNSYTEVSFQPAEYIKSGYISGYRGGGKSYQQFKLLDDKKKIKLETNMLLGSEKGKKVIIATINYYMNNTNFLVEKKYVISKNENIFFERIFSLDKIYFYDKNIEKEIVINDIGKFEKVDENKFFNSDYGLLIYPNNEKENEKNISDFLLSTKVEFQLEHDSGYFLKKIDSYQTDFGTLYILEKEHRTSSGYINPKMTEYIGILKYANNVNQELIFLQKFNSNLNSNINDFISILEKIIQKNNIYKKIC